MRICTLIKTEERVLFKYNFIIIVWKSVLLHPVQPAYVHILLNSNFEKKVSLLLLLELLKATQTALFNIHIAHLLQFSPLSLIFFLENTCIFIALCRPINQFSFLFVLIWSRLLHAHLERLWTTFLLHQELICCHLYFIHILNYPL